MPGEIFVPPKNLGEWTIETIDSLISSNYPESDSLEFKENMDSNVEKDICGFANSDGGLIVIGIAGKDKAESKRPFSDEHKISQQLTGKMALIDPTPIIESKTIPEGTNFYLIMKINDVPHMKPFNLKNTGSFYIRFNGSTQPASRSVILNLFSTSINRRQRLMSLKASIEMLTKELSLKNQNATLRVSKDFIHRIPEIDLLFIKSVIANSWDLIYGLDKIGKVESQSYSSGLLTTVLPKIAGVNANIRGFNNSFIGTKEKEQLANYLDEFARGIPSLNQELDKFKAAIEKMLAD